MKIYTRTGDKGETSLADGTRVPKNHPRLEAYGVVDELNAQLGVVQSVVPDKAECSRIIRIQNRLFAVGAQLATEDDAMAAKIPCIWEEDILELEQAMDQMMNQVKTINGFVLPAGHMHVAMCHVARTVCRRAERNIITLSKAVYVDPILIRYINRLSDYLFILARKTASDLGINELMWTSHFRDDEHHLE